MSPHSGHRLRLAHLVFALLICLAHSALINNAPGTSDISSIIMQNNFGRNGGYAPAFTGGYSPEKPLGAYGGGVIPKSDTQWGGYMQASGNVNPQYIPQMPVTPLKQLNNMKKQFEDRRNILSQVLTLSDLAKADFYLPENSSTKKKDYQETVTQPITSGFFFLPLQSNQPDIPLNTYSVQSQLSPSPSSEAPVYLSPVKDQVKDQPKYQAGAQNNTIMSAQEVSELQSNLLALQKNMQQTQTNQLFNRFTNEFNDNSQSGPSKKTTVSYQPVQSIYKQDSYTSTQPTGKPLYQSNPQNYDTMVSSLRDSINNRFNNLFKP